MHISMFKVCSYIIHGTGADTHFLNRLSSKQFICSINGSIVPDKKKKESPWKVINRGNMNMAGVEGMKRAVAMAVLMY